MNQMPVKWVESGFLLDDAAKLRYAGVRQRGMIPIIKLSALREVVEELRDGYTGDYWAYKWALNDLLAMLGEIPKQNSGSTGTDPLTRKEDEHE